MEQTITPISAGQRHASIARLQEGIRKRGVGIVELWASDLAGRPRRLCIIPEMLDDRFFEQGITLDGPSTAAEWREGLITLLPDPDAAFPDPVAKVPVLSLFCDLVGQPSARALLREAEEQIQRELGATPQLGAEGEFVLLDAQGRPAREEQVWPVLRALALTLSQAGIQFDGFRYGPGRGQGRVQMRADSPLRIADRMTYYRYLIRAVASQHGLRPTFLPKPFADADTANHMPIHVSLWRDGTNLFHDEEGWALTSRTARGFAGGLIKHTAALLAVVAPSTNSYRRLIPGSAPLDLCLGTGRLAAVRVPARSRAENARRLKFRLADGTANPYLAFAAVLLAGLDGIVAGLEPPTAEPPAQAAAVPHSLEEALEALKTSRLLPEDLKQAWLADRWQRQVLPVRSVPHPAELELEGES
jgi:glutamine synthetase